jgi:hypothetical protein
MKRRKLAITKDGYIGAALQEAQLDDLICVLFGYSVPIVLRKMVVAKAIPNEASHRFIREAYLYGFMDTEAIATLVKGIRTVQAFALK